MSSTRCCSGVSRRCKLLSTVTRLFYSVQTRPIVSALITILPRALGTEVFLRGRSDLNIGASPVTLVGPVRSLSAASKTSHLPNARRGHSIHPGRRSGTYFPLFFFFLFFFPLFFFPLFFFSSVFFFLFFFSSVFFFSPLVFYSSGFFFPLFFFPLGFFFLCFFFFLWFFYSSGFLFLCLFFSSVFLKPLSF